MLPLRFPAQVLGAPRLLLFLCPTHCGLLGQSTTCSRVRNGFFYGHWHLKEVQHTVSTQGGGENPQVPCEKGSRPWAILPPRREQVEMFADIFTVTAGRVGTLGVCQGDATKHMTMHSTVPTTDNYQAPKVSSAAVDKSCHGSIG